MNDTLVEKCLLSGGPGVFVAERCSAGSNPLSATGSFVFAGFRTFRSSTQFFVYNISIGSVQGFGGLFSLGRFGVRVPGIVLDVLLLTVDGKKTDAVCEAVCLKASGFATFMTRGRNRRDG